MRRAWTTWLAWSTWALTIALYAGALTVKAIADSAAADDQAGFTTVSLLVAFIGFATVGALVSSRWPHNAVGWIFLAVGLLVGLSAFGGQYANYVFVDDPGSLPGGRLAGWFYLWTWFPAIGLVSLLPLLFPDGRVPGPRWRPVLWVMAGVLSVVTVLWWFRPGWTNDADMARWGTNPIGVGALDPIYGPVEKAASAIFIAFLVTSGASSVVRFRRSRGDERQQLKWATFGIVVMVAFSIAPAFVLPDIGDLGLALTLAALPAATAVAMFKYRLYEIDRVISKTLVYGSLTVVLGAAYAALVLAGQALFSSVAGGSDLAIAVSTLVVAALFLPLRSRVQRLVDRRFYRRRYDAQRTLAAFAARLRERVDLDELRSDVESVVTETVQPEHVAVWLREVKA